VTARSGLRVALAVLMLAAAAGVGLVSIRSSRAALSVLEACDAVERGDLERALALTRERVGPDDTGRAAAECRCRALVARGEASACAALLEDLWSHPRAADWMPAADLAVLAIDARRSQGRTREAAALARRAGLAHPDDLQLFALELDARASVEVEARVLEELALRLPAEGRRAAELRAVLAQRHLRAGDPAAALRVLGERPPPGSGDVGLWFDTRAMAFALADDLAGVRRTIAEWGAAGGDPAELRGRYALALSIAGLRDPERDTISLLREALAATADGGDETLRAGLVIRLVLTLAHAKRLPEALATYDRYREQLPLDGLSREELERAVRVEALAGAPVSASSLPTWTRPSTPPTSAWRCPPIAGCGSSAARARPRCAGCCATSRRCWRRAWPSRPRALGSGSPSSCASPCRSRRSTAAPAPTPTAAAGSRWCCSTAATGASSATCSPGASCR
jgi:hypothetical protein